MYSESDPSEIPFEIILLFEYFYQYVNHFGSSVSLLKIICNCNGIKLSRLSYHLARIQLGYFQVMADPVST